MEPALDEVGGSRSPQSIEIRGKGSFRFPLRIKPALSVCALLVLWELGNVFFANGLSLAASWSYVWLVIYESYRCCTADYLSFPDHAHLSNTKRKLTNASNISQKLVACLPSPPTLSEIHMVYSKCNQPVPLTQVLEKIPPMKATTGASFATIGDWGVVNVALRNTAQQLAHQKIQYILALGDNFYEKGTCSVEDEKWQNNFEQIFNHPNLKETPFYAVLGNHDYHLSPFSQIVYHLAFPDSRRWYMPNYWYYTVQTYEDVPEKLVEHPHNGVSAAEPKPPLGTGGRTKTDSQVTNAAPPSRPDSQHHLQKGSSGSDEPELVTSRVEAKPTTVGEAERADGGIEATSSEPRTADKLESGAIAGEGAEGQVDSPSGSTGRMTVVTIFIDTELLTMGELSGNSLNYDALYNKQLTFLEHALKAGASVADWLFVVGHYEVYSSGTAHGDLEPMKRQLLPLLDKYKVDAYFNGHDHHLELLFDPQCGVHFYVSGSAAKRRPVHCSNPLCLFASDEHGFTTHVLTRHEMYSAFISQHGQILKTYTQRSRRAQRKKDVEGSTSEGFPPIELVHARCKPSTLLFGTPVCCPDKWFYVGTGFCAAVTVWILVTVIRCVSLTSLFRRRIKYLPIITGSSNSLDRPTGTSTDEAEDELPSVTRDVSLSSSTFGRSAEASRR